MKIESHEQKERVQLFYKAHLYIHDQQIIMQCSILHHCIRVNTKEKQGQGYLKG